MRRRSPAGGGGDSGAASRHGGLHARGDRFGALDEARGGRGRAGLVRGSGEQVEPALEMGGRDRQGEMLGQGAAVIASAMQNDRGPEGIHLLEMRIPVLDRRGEDRGEALVLAHARIETIDQRADHRLVDAGPGFDRRAGGGPARPGSIETLV